MDISNDISDNSYARYVVNLVTAYISKNPEIYQIALSNFQNFVLAKYQADISNNDDKKTLNEIFKAVSTQSSKNTLIIFNALIEIEFSDKRTKANRIADHVMLFEPDPDPMVYKLLENIISYLYRSLRSSILLILQPIRDKIWVLCAHTDPEQVKSCIYTLTMLLRKFPFCLEAVMVKVQTTIAFVLQNANAEVRALACELLKVFVNLDYSNNNICNNNIEYSNDGYNNSSYLTNTQVMNLASRCATQLLNSAIKTKEGFVFGAEIILERYPELISKFKFTSISLDALDSPEIEKKLSALSFLPFAVRTSPELFDTSTNVSFFNKIEPMLHKKSQNRNEALLSFGKFIFNQKFKYNEELKIIEKCKKAIAEALDSDQAVYAYLASLFVKPQTLVNESSIIFQQGISSYLIDGFRTIIETDKSLQNHILKNLLIMADRIILRDVNSSSADTNQIRLFFESFPKFNIPHSLLSLSNAVQYSKHLYSPDLSVRRAVTEFLMKYHEEDMPEEFVLILLTYVGIETDDSIRFPILKKLAETKLTSPEIVSSFQMLLTDFNRKIRLFAYNYIIKYLYNDDVKIIIERCLHQSIRELQQETKLKKIHLEPFLVLSREAFQTNNSNNCNGNNNCNNNNNSNNSNNNNSNNNNSDGNNDNNIDNNNDYCDNDDNKNDYLLNERVALSTLSCFTPFLIKRILNDPGPLFSDALEVLSYLICMPSSQKGDDEDERKEEINVDLLVNHLKNALNPHFSKHCLDAALKALDAGIRFTSLKETIYHDHSLIIQKLVKLTKLHSIEISYSLLFNTLAKIGAVKPSLISNQSDEVEENKRLTTASIFIAQCTKGDTKDKLIYASVGVSISEILNILAHDSLAALHSDAVSTLKEILNASRIISDSLTDELINRIKLIFQSNSLSTATTILSSIQVFLAVLDVKFDPVIRTIVNFICEQWGNIDQILLIKATIHITRFLPQSLQPLLPQLVSCFVKNIEFTSPKIAMIIFSALEAMGPNISTVDYIVYPAILSYVTVNCQNSDCKGALEQLRIIFAYGGTIKFATKIVHTLLQILIISPKLNDVIADIITVVAVHQGKSFLQYLPQIKPYIMINDNMPLTSVIRSFEHDLPITDTVRQMCTPDSIGKISIEAHSVISNTTAPQLNVPSDEYDESRWQSWSEEFCSSMIRQSSSSAIQLCAQLAERHNILKEMLTPISIVMLYLDPPQPHYGERLKNIINVVVTSHKVPRSLMRMFLGVIELLEFMQTPLPVGIDIICRRAMSIEMIPFALYFAEKVFMMEKLPERRTQKEVTQNLLTVNQQLGLPLSNKGIISILKDKNIELDVGMKEKLGLWEEAYELYEENLKKDPSNKKFFIRSLYCLQKMSKFERLKENSAGYRIYNVGALWHLLENDSFAEEAEKLNESDFKPIFYRTLLYIIKGNYKLAQDRIDKLKSLKCDHILQLISEDYERSMPEFNSLAIVYDLESVLSYKVIQSKLEKADLYDQKYWKMCLKQNVSQWETRFNNLPDNGFGMYEQICVRFLVMDKVYMKPYVKRLINCLAQEKQTEVAATVLKICNTFSESEEEMIRAEIEWHNKKCSEALDLVKKAILKDDSNPDLYFTAGKWLISLKKLPEAREMLEKAVTNLPKRADVWELWSKINILLSAKNPDNLVTALEASINGLISTNDDHLKFTLQIMSILFRNGSKKIYRTLSKRYKEIKADLWIPVLPQIVARLNSKKDDESQLKHFIEKLLLYIGEVHPHAIIYSLLVFHHQQQQQYANIARANSNNDSNINNSNANNNNDNSSTDKLVTQRIFDKLKQQFPQIVEKTLRFAKEFVRVGYIWLEQYIELYNRALIEMKANRLQKKDAISVFNSLFAKLSQNPETAFEESFIRQFSKPITEARSQMKAYSQNNDEKQFNGAWGILADVYKQIQTKYENLGSKWSLASTSPFLFELKDDEVAVPGTLLCQQNEAIAVKTIQNEILIISSNPNNTSNSFMKNKHRKIKIIGNNGVTYVFVLKAHEDLRLDERMMKLFEYINNVSLHSSLPFKNRLTITTYKAIPLSSDVGLVGWIENVQNLNNLIVDYRSRSNVQVDAEKSLSMSSFGGSNQSDYDKLSFGKKRTKIFRKGLEATLGDDLEKIIFLNSADSEHWLLRRTIYSTSLAMNSIVGFVIGLGNRNLFNILMKDKTAKIVHIDFTESFERAKTPEKVPFRLTRLLQNALEVSKIEGTFRSCCENVLKLMRSNNDQISGLLEVFIYDPLYQTNGGSENEFLKRIEEKLKGLNSDERDKEKLTVNEQVDILIKQATNEVNLASMCANWNAWW